MSAATLAAAPAAILTAAWPPPAPARGAAPAIVICARASVTLLARGRAARVAGERARRPFRDVAHAISDRAGRYSFPALRV